MYMKVNIAIPIIIMLLAISSEYSGFDLWLASHFYDAKMHVWPYKNHFIMRNVLYIGQNYLVLITGIITIIFSILSYCCNSLFSCRKHLLYIIIASVSGPLMIYTLKNITHIYTPWVLEIFGGSRPYIRIFDSLPSNAPVGHAFPGGHSSEGFTFICLYFLLLYKHSRYRYYVLILIVFLGFSFAMTQEIRGAHFLSHDLFSLSICWFCCLIYAIFFYDFEMLVANKERIFSITSSQI